MKDLILEAEKRELASKGTVRSNRLKGFVPGIAYGDKEAPVLLSINEKSFQSIIHSERGRNALITLKVSGTTHPVLIKEIQRHAITRAILHVDLHRVSLKKKIEASVPLHVKGEAPGVKLGGGVLEHVLRDVRVRCLPMDIPAAIDVDVSALQINQSLKAKDLQVPAGVELLVDMEAVVVNVVSPTILEEPAAGAAAAAPGSATAEPEVIKKGKVEAGEEGSAAPAAAGADKKAAAPAAKAEAKK